MWHTVESVEPLLIELATQSEFIKWGTLANRYISSKFYCTQKEKPYGKRIQDYIKETQRAKYYDWSNEIKMYAWRFYEIMKIFCPKRSVSEKEEKTETL